MIVAKFMVFAFLIALVTLLALRSNPGIPVGGPYFFMDRPDSRNPIKPNLQLKGWQAFHRRNVWRVWFDGKGHPTELQFFHDGKKQRRILMAWDKYGEIRSRREEDFQ